MQHARRKRPAARISDESIEDGFMMGTKKRRVEGDAGTSSCLAPENEHSNTNLIFYSKMKLSVWEKLQLGIAMGVSRENRKRDAVYSSFVETISHHGFGSYRRCPSKPFESLSDAQKAIGDQFGFTHHEDPSTPDGLYPV